MLTRRQVIQKTVGVGVVASVANFVVPKAHAISGGTLRQTIVFNKTPFLNIFQQINIPYGTIPECPIDMLAPNINRPNVCHYVIGTTNCGNTPNYTYIRNISNRDPFIIPTFDIRKDSIGEMYQRMDWEAAKLIVAAGADKNVLVFDSKSPRGKPTISLIGQMTAAMWYQSNKCKKMSHIYMSEHFKDSFKHKFHRKQVHFVDSSAWRKLEHFYRNEVRGIYGDNDDNLIIGTCQSDYDFIHIRRGNYEPIRHLNEYVLEIGFASLNNQGILLGSF